MHGCQRQAALRPYPTAYPACSPHRYVPPCATAYAAGRRHTLGFFEDRSAGMPSQSEGGSTYLRQGRYKILPRNDASRPALYAPCTCARSILHHVDPVRTRCNGSVKTTELCLFFQ